MIRDNEVFSDPGTLCELTWTVFQIYMNNKEIPIKIK